ncbi:hypothetical protein [Kitasatospora albolonga]|uniref:hypothetical protein n=1 Tax=Kitasatospora albolonga TaxID=68173 RepID=UPI0031EBCE8B
MFHPAPPLPAAPPPLTDDLAERWLAARTAQRWDSRWLCAVPLLVCVVAMGQAARTPLLCGPAHPCGQSWAEGAIAAALLAEAVALLARPRGLVLIPAALLPLIWYVPDGLPDQVSRWTALAAQAALLVVLARAGAGRRAARQRLADLMGGQQPYPWTLAGAPAPAPPRPVVRLVLGGLLLGLAAVSVLTGLERQEESDARAARAETVPGRVLSSDELGDTEVEYRLPGDDRPRTAGVEVYWGRVPEAGRHPPAAGRPRRLGPPGRRRLRPHRLADGGDAARQRRPGRARLLGPQRPPDPRPRRPRRPRPAGGAPPGRRRGGGRPRGRRPALAALHPAVPRLERHRLGAARRLPAPLGGRGGPPARTADRPALPGA